VLKADGHFERSYSDYRTSQNSWLVESQDDPQVATAGQHWSWLTSTSDGQPPAAPRRPRKMKYKSCISL
jgi:hypothetical protein